MAAGNPRLKWVSRLGECADSPAAAPRPSGQFRGAARTIRQAVRRTDKDAPGVRSTTGLKVLVFHKG